MQFAVCNEIFQGWTLSDTLACAARLGYAAVEIAPFTLANSVTDISTGERRAMREAAARNKMAIAGIHWVLVKPEGLYINHPDRSVRERTAEYFCDLVDFCADIGGGVMVVGSPKQRNQLPGVSREQAWEWAAATLRNAVAQAEQREVTICVEPLAPAETNFINTAAEALQFVQYVVHNAKSLSTFGLQPFPVAMLYSNVTPPAPIQALVSQGLITNAGALP